MGSYWQPEYARDVRIPVAKPRLPSCEKITPYLRRIDQSGWYSNGGPLVRELEAKLERHAGRVAHVATVANATIGLTLALLAHDPPTGALCMVPGWTFAATGHAILLAGLTPWIVDVDRSTWALEASTARELLLHAPGNVAAVIPVSPFGAPIDLQPWEDFREETGIAVVLDAAAAFDSMRASSLPSVVSLHATKVLGIGEGGFVLSTDETFIEEVQKRANFGFWNSREATARSMNGKLSEYAAAIGLAALADWPAARVDFAGVARAYRQQLSGQDNVTLQPGLGNDWVSSTVMVLSAEKPVDNIAHALASARIGARRWWGGGLHRHRAFADFPCHRTGVTESLASLTIGLPCWRDLPVEEVKRICDLVLSA